MDISQGPGNSITVIEEFIEKRYPRDPEYYGFQPSATYVLPFEFPPGHRLRICKFVQEVRTRVCRQKPKPKPVPVTVKSSTCRRIKLKIECEKVSVHTKSVSIPSQVKFA